MSIYLKRTIATITFIIGLFAMLFSLSYLSLPQNNKSAYGVEDTSANTILAEEPNSIDVLVFGDSESYSNISPLEIWKNSGIPSFICGTRAQRLDYTQILMERAFSEQSPKVVILETNTLYRKISADTQAADVLSLYLPVFKYHNRWKLILGGALAPVPADLKGYKHNLETNPASNINYMKYSDEVEEIPQLNVDYVKEIKEFCDENGAEFLLVSTPSAKNWNYKRHNAVSKLAENLDCAYLDLNALNDEIKIDWKTDTRDGGDHLNHSGAVKASKYLAEYLKSTDKFVDKRNDSAYSAWNDSLDYYNNLLK